MSDPISIQDIEAGNVDIEEVFAYLDSLHTVLENIRYEMNMYMTTLGTMDEMTRPQAVYREMSDRIMTLKTQFSLFFHDYKRVLPMVRYFKIKHGMSPDDSIKITPHRVPVDAKLINEIKAADVDVLLSGTLVSNVSTPSVPAANTSTTNTPGNPGPATAANPPARKGAVKTAKKKSSIKK